MKNLLSILVAVVIISASASCDKAQANVQTLVSNDCGVTWELIKPGEVIPKRITACELKTTIPGSPMVGESVFKTTFKNNVKAQINLDYEYVIIDPVLFITEAKYLAKADVSGDEVSTNNGRFESAENSIIDKRIKDVSRDLLNAVDIVDFDQSEFEDTLLTNVNASLAKRGVQINFLSFVPEPSQQTAAAIDVATAMRIYGTKGLDSLGVIVIANKARANNIIINSGTAPATTEENK